MLSRHLTGQPGVERRRHAGEGQYPRRHVDERRAGAAGSAIALAGHGHHAGEGLQHQVVAGLAGQWSLVAIAADGDMHKVWRDGAQGFVVDAQSFGDRRKEVVDNHIGLGDQAFQDFLTRGALEVQRHAALAAIDAEGSWRCGHRRPTPICGFRPRRHPRP